MSAREVVFLGTGSQVPSRGRAHNALFLLWDDLGILFDPGEGTQRQMILAGLAATQITHIAITHFHGDHCLGLAGTVQRLSLDRVTRPVEVVFPASGEVYFERLRRASVFHDVTTLVPRPVARAADDPEAAIEVTRMGTTLRLLARPLDHVIDCFGYRLQEDDSVRMLPERLEAHGVRGPAVSALKAEGRLEIDGRTVRLEDVSEPRPGQSFALVMDTRVCEGARALARGVDLLVSEATFVATEAEEAASYGHMTAADAATLARDAGVRRLALTHFSQRYTSLDAHAAEARAIHPDVAIAEDLKRVSVPRRDRGSADHGA